MVSSDTSAAATSSLSATGSSRVPSVVTWLRRRATTPSSQSVNDAATKMAAAIRAWTRDDEMRNRMSSGAATIRVIVPASRLAKWKTASQYLAITMLILEKGLISPTFHVAATVMLWGALALTVVSAVDYFYRFFRKADYRAIVPEEQRWS